MLLTAAVVPALLGAAAPPAHNCVVVTAHADARCAGGDAPVPQVVLSSDCTAAAAGRHGRATCTRDAARLWQQCSDGECDDGAQAAGCPSQGVQLPLPGANGTASCVAPGASVYCGSCCAAPLPDGTMHPGCPAAPAWCTTDARAAACSALARSGNCSRDCAKYTACFAAACVKSYGYAAVDTTPFDAASAADLCATGAIRAGKGWRGVPEGALAQLVGFMPDGLCDALAQGTRQYYMFDAMEEDGKGPWGPWKTAAGREFTVPRDLWAPGEPADEPRHSLLGVTRDAQGNCKVARLPDHLRRKRASDDIGVICRVRPHLIGTAAAPTAASGAPSAPGCGLSEPHAGYYIAGCLADGCNPYPTLPEAERVCCADPDCGGVMLSQGQYHAALNSPLEKSAAAGETAWQRVAAPAAPPPATPLPQTAQPSGAPSGAPRRVLCGHWPGEAAYGCEGGLGDNMVGPAGTDDSACLELCRQQLLGAAKEATLCCATRDAGCFARLGGGSAAAGSGKSRTVTCRDWAPGELCKLRCNVGAECIGLDEDRDGCIDHCSCPPAAAGAPAAGSEFGFPPVEVVSAPEAPTPVAPPPRHAGLGAFAVALLITVALFTFYCAMGITARVQQGEQSCPEVMPNHEFWIALPGAVCNGLQALCGALRSASAAGYGKLAQTEEAALEQFDNDPIPEAS
eukprot:TRINITY_DN1793_c2_g1_i1.p1 TRINITY_DN1793_c2_g1~~TRINITY_DN1793_c2_g1_i1.p1  ORF type:complete len:713 (+),score=185.47 TRINITY_DN1793_c2_g1_i1:90-2141(+)